MTDNIITTEHIGNYINYICNISKSFVTFEKKDNNLRINNTNLDWDEPKLAIHILNYSLTDVIKKINVKYFLHTIKKDEQHVLDMTKWTIIEDDDIILELRCPIENSVENVLYGFVHQ